VNRKLLIGLLAALALVVLWQYVGPSGGDDAPPAGLAARPGHGVDPEEGAPAAALPNRGRAAAAKAPSDHVVELRVADLERPPRSYTPGRDPWRFKEPPPPPPPPPPPKPSAAELARQRAEQERLAREREAELERQRQEALIPKPPPFTWSYLGSFGPAERRIAVFTDGKSIFNAQQGETMAGKFIVAHIGYESVDIKFVGFPDVPAQRLAVGHPAHQP
jgi:hypothetical protein